MFWILVDAAVLLIIVSLIVEFLIAFMPSSLRRLASANRRRRDGTFSPRRDAYENRAIVRLRKDLYAILLTMCGGFAALLLVVHLFVFPLDILAGGVSSFSPDKNEFRASLKEKNLDRRLEERWTSTFGLSAETSERTAREVWRRWPIFAAGAALLLYAFGATLKWGYMRALRDYARSLNARRQQYQMRDLARGESV